MSLSVTSECLVVSKALVGSAGAKEIAESVKREVDMKPELNLVPGKGPWHCIVGKSFSVALSHEREYALMVDIPTYNLTILLFKSFEFNPST